MGNDGCMGGQVIVAVRQLAGDRHADGLIGASYRWCNDGGWSDGWSDDIGQPDGWCTDCWTVTDGLMDGQG